MDRLVKTHLYRAEHFHIVGEILQHLRGGIGAAQIGENERIHVLAHQAGERIFAVAQFAVECEVELHFAVDEAIGVLLLQYAHCFVHIGGAAVLIAAEVGERNHSHHRLFVEELNGVLSQFSHIYEGVGARVAIDECVGYEECAVLGVEYMHGAEVVISWLYAHHFLCHLDGVAVFCVGAGDKCVGFAGFHHHHTEVVALEHLIIGFLECVAFAGALGGKYLGVALAATCFAVVA